MADRRSKGCPNSSCEGYKKKIKHKSDDDFCPKCGSRLIYVCSKCFKEIEDTNEKHRICKRCKTESDELKNKMKDGALKVGKSVAGLAGTVAVGVVTNLKKDGTTAAVAKGTEMAKNVVNTILKK